MALNKVDQTYHNYLKEVLTGARTNFRPAARTSASTVGNFGLVMEFDCSKEELPVITTKQVYMKTLVTELAMFLRGETDLREYLKRNCNIWNGNAFTFNAKKIPDSHKYGKWKYLEKDTPEFDEAQQQYIEEVKSNNLPTDWCSLGDIYGAQWRRWKTSDGREIDQLEHVLGQLKTNPFSRYHIVSAWNPGEFDNMALPPCHMKHQFYVRDGRDGERYLDVSLDQRSADSLLGVAFNELSYASELRYFANILGYKPGVFTHILQDAHIYVGKGDVAQWYQKNFFSISDQIKECHSPTDYLTLRDDILSKRPYEELGSHGLDHIPYVLTQLSRQNSGTMPTLNFVGEGAKNINLVDKDTFEFKNYTNAGKLELKLGPNGKEIPAKMAA